LCTIFVHKVDDYFVKWTLFLRNSSIKLILFKVSNSKNIDISR
jgi:hypothetical protein